MAGIDLDAQRAGTIPGLGRVEAGFIDFSAGTDSLDVPTRHSPNTFIMGFGIAETVYVGVNQANQRLIATTDGDVTDGNVTFVLAGPSGQAGDVRVRYMLIGW